MLTSPHTTREVVDGVLTGRLHSESSQWVTGKDKAAFLRAAEEQAPKGALTVAFSDHAKDLPLLHAAQDVTVVNPGSTLNAIAAEKGWQRLVCKPEPWTSPVENGAMAQGQGEGTSNH